MDDEALERMAEEAEPEFVRRRRVMEDFLYDEAQAAYWDTTSGALLSAKSVDGAIRRDDWPTRPNRDGELVPYNPSKAINDVDTGLTVESSTWWPGKPRIIRDQIMCDRGLLEIPGAQCYNNYTPPRRKYPPEGVTATKWIDHVKKLWPSPEEHEHFFDFAAHAIQRPDEKINHGIVMAGSMGIGKDTAMLPLRYGVGTHNAAEIEPDTISSNFNGYVKSVLLVINEVRPHDEDHKSSNFYNQLKPLLAAPPELLPMEVKHANPVYIRNVCHVILTTNDPLTMYIPPEDRRLFVMTSQLPDPKTSDVFPEDYFADMYDYLDNGGKEAAIMWLANRDISHLDAGAPPPMTDGKRAIMTSAHQVRRSAADDVIEAFVEELYGGEKPPVIFHRDLSDFVRQGNYFDDEQEVIRRINAKNFHYKMAEHGYDMLRNPDGPEWKRGKFRTRMAFCLRSIDDQDAAVRDELSKRPLVFGREEKF